MKPNKNNIIKEKLDDNDFIVIDYFDRINKKWIKVETTKKVARFLKADSQKRRRKQNEYNFYTTSLNEFLDGDDEENENDADCLVDPSNLTLEQIEELRVENAKKEEQRTAFENAICRLTPKQRKCVELMYYNNMNYSEIARECEITKQTVNENIKYALGNIKKYIEKHNFS